MSAAITQLRREGTGGEEAEDVVEEGEGLLLFNRVQPAGLDQVLVHPLPVLQNLTTHTGETSSHQRPSFEKGRGRGPAHGPL